MTRRNPKSSTLLLLFAAMASLAGAVLYIILPRETTFTTSINLHSSSARLWVDQAYSPENLRAFAGATGLDLNILEASFLAKDQTNMIVSPKVEDRVSQAMFENSVIRHRKNDRNVNFTITHVNPGIVQQFIEPYFNSLQTSYLATWISTFEATQSNLVGSSDIDVQANIFGAPVSNYVDMRVQSKLLAGSAFASAPSTEENNSFGLAFIISMTLLIAIAFTAMGFLAIRYFDLIRSGFALLQGQQHGYDEKTHRPIREPAE